MCCLRRYFSWLIGYRQVGLLEMMRIWLDLEFVPLLMCFILILIKKLNLKLIYFNVPLSMRSKFYFFLPKTISSSQNITSHHRNHDISFEKLQKPLKNSFNHSNQKRSPITMKKSSNNRVCCSNFMCLLKNHLMRPSFDVIDVVWVIWMEFCDITHKSYWFGK